MLKRIEKGEAQGILTWHPDRLARNSLDGGRIIFLLDTGALKDLRFASFSFENNPQGKFMLSIIFGYSKYYVDNLSENVRRGNRTKVAQGWRPGSAPLGYLNDPATRTIVRDPDRFPLVRRLWELVLTGVHGPRDLWRIATKDWQLRTPQRKRSGGNLISLSGVYRLLDNPFYAGVIKWEGKLHTGKHEAMITLNDFQHVQELLARAGRPRPQRHTWAYTGLIRCGECGCGITAENKRNRFGSIYVYYHCTKKKPASGCRQPVISVLDLEEQLFVFLKDLAPAERIHNWVISRLGRADAGREDDIEAQRRSLDLAQTSATRQLDNLTKLRLRDLLTDDEYVAQRATLEQEQIRINQNRELLQRRRWLEPAITLTSFSSQLVSRFTRGTSDDKRLILEIVGSNLSLKDKKLSIDAAKPFRRWSTSSSDSERRAFVQDVRTFANDPANDNVFAKIRELSTLSDDDTDEKRAA